MTLAVPSSKVLGKFTLLALSIVAVPAGLLTIHIRKDLGVKNLPFVIAETGMNGPQE